MSLTMGGVVRHRAGESWGPSRCTACTAQLPRSARRGVDQLSNAADQLGSITSGSMSVFVRYSTRSSGL